MSDQQVLRFIKTSDAIIHRYPTLNRSIAIPGRYPIARREVEFKISFGEWIEGCVGVATMKRAIDWVEKSSWRYPFVLAVHTLLVASALVITVRL